MYHTHQKAIGRSVPRREDARLVTGRGRYVADIDLADALHLSFVRSPLPHGRIVDCDIGAALEMPGVHAVFAGADVCHLGRLSINPVLELKGPFEYPLLAHERVEAVGQPVAAVLAETPHEGLDAVDAVYVDLDDNIHIKPADGRISGAWRSGDVDRLFDDAAHIVSTTVEHPRLAPSPIEPRGVAVDYHRDTDTVTVWYSTQTPHRARYELSTILEIAEERITVVAPDVGGAFGMKASLYPEEVVAVWAAFELKRSVRWVAARSEDFLSASHGRGARSQGELAVAKDGRFLALRARIDSPLGHWLPSSAAIPAWNAGRILPCGYDIEAVDIVSEAHLCNTAPVGIYRGAGRPEANCLMERLVDAAATATGLDPLAIRLKNLLPPDRFPCQTPTGYLLDSGRYADALEALRRAADYDSMQENCKQRRREGEVVGLGFGFYVEPCGNGWESARVTLNPDGTAEVATGGSSQGHGRETAFAQIAADALSLSVDAVSVVHGSTAKCPNGIGALASRSTAIGGSAVKQACEAASRTRQKGDDPSQPATAETVYEADGEAWGYGCYLVMLSIDAETGVPTIEQAYCVDDAGTVINPAMVEGQIRGGFAQGLGEALMERLVYDDGQLVTGSFMDYGVPRASDVPGLSISKLETPSSGNVLGAKGVGEAGTIGAPAAILNAAIDALRPFGVTTLQMPLTSEQLWQAMQAAQSR